MERQTFADLAAKSQAGDQEAMEQLLLRSYAPVSYQCRKLLQNDRAAEAAAKEILKVIRSKIHTLNNPELFEKWMGRITAKRCMQLLNQQNREKTPQPKPVEAPNGTLDARQTAQVVDQIVDTLPEGPRVCLLLYCCSGISAKGIAQLTGYTESAVMAHLNRAQDLVNRQLHQYHDQGVRFAAITSLPELLRIAMYRRRSAKAAAAVVNGIMGKQAVPVVPAGGRPPRNPKMVIAIVTAATLLVMTLGLTVVLEHSLQEAPEPSAEVTETTQMETEATTIVTTVETTVETTEETTVETTAETTQATTVPETTEETTEPTTEPTKAPAPQTPQSQGGQQTSGGGNTASSSGTGGNHTHSYQDAGKIGMQPAGCESAGWRTKICFVCGDTVKYEDPVNLPPLGHNYSSTVKPPTTGREGFTIHTCTRCGLTYMDNYVPKLPEETQPPVTQAQPTEVVEAVPEGSQEG